MAKRETIQLSNGMFFDPNTGSVWLPGEKPNEYAYRYDAGTQKTTIGGNQYAGRYDPFILSSITEDDNKSASEYHSAWMDKKFSDLEKNPFIVGSEGSKYGDSYADKQYQSHLSPILGAYDALTLGTAYAAAKKKYQGQTFFGELDDYRNQLADEDKRAAQVDSREKEYQTEVAKIKNMYSHPNTQKAMIAVVDQKYGKNQPVKEPTIADAYESMAKQQVPQQPTAQPPAAPSEPKPVASKPDVTTQPVLAATPAVSPMPSTPPGTPQETKPQELDWTKLYDSLSGYINDLSNQVKSTHKPQQAKAQIANYYDYGPNAASRQSTFKPTGNYVGTTQYSGKGQ